MKASELVPNKIRTYPARFGEFLEVLLSYNWLKDVLKSVTTAYEELQKKDKKGNDTEDVATHSTEGIIHVHVFPSPFVFL